MAWEQYRLKDALLGKSVNTFGDAGVQLASIPILEKLRFAAIHSPILESGPQSGQISKAARDCAIGVAGKSPALGNGLHCLFVEANAGVLLRKCLIGALRPMPSDVGQPHYGQRAG